jgi:hypothetical protein
LLKLPEVYVVPKLKALSVLVVMLTFDSVEVVKSSVKLPVAVPPVIERHAVESEILR